MLHRYRSTALPSLPSRTGIAHPLLSGHHVRFRRQAPSLVVSRAFGLPDLQSLLSGSETPTQFVDQLVSFCNMLPRCELWCLNYGGTEAQPDVVV